MAKKTAARRANSTSGKTSTTATTRTRKPKAKPAVKSANARPEPADPSVSGSRDLTGSAGASASTSDLKHPDKPVAKNKNRSRNRDKKRGPISMRPTEDELDERCTIVANMLSTGSTKRDIKAYCNEHYGITARTTESYITRAKEILRERREFRSAEDELNMALDYWIKLSNDPTIKPDDRMKARRRYEELIQVHRTAERIYSEQNNTSAPDSLGSISGIGRPRVEVMKDAILIMQRAVSDGEHDTQASTSTSGSDNADDDDS